jgi:hypothetical protein
MEKKKSKTRKQSDEVHNIFECSILRYGGLSAGNTRGQSNLGQQAGQAHGSVYLISLQQSFSSLPGIEFRKSFKC